MVRVVVVVRMAVSVVMIGNEGDDSRVGVRVELLMVGLVTGISIC